MKTVCALLLTVIFTVPALCQPNPDTLWTREFGGTNYEIARAIDSVPSGGFILAGNTDSYGAGFDDVFLVRVNEQGDTLWTRFYGGPALDAAFAVQSVPSGGFIVTGETRSFGPGAPTMPSIYLLRLDDSGDTLWTRALGIGNSSFGRSVLCLADSGFVIAGGASPPGEDYQAVLVRTDYLGMPVWTHYYGGPMNDYVEAVKRTSDGNFVLVGHYGVPPSGESDMYIVKTDGVGDTLWTRHIGDAATTGYAYAVNISEDGCIVAGSSTAPDAGYLCMTLMRLNSQGDTLWTRRYMPEDYGTLNAVQTLPNGAFVVAGQHRVLDGISEAILAEVSSSGDMLWHRSYGQDRFGSAYGLLRTPDGGYVLAGTIDFPDEDMYLVRTGPDYLSVEEHAAPSPTNWLLSAAPNPFNPTTTLSFALLKAGRTKIAIYDIDGREVRTLWNEELGVGEHQLVFDGSGLASGIYFARLDAGSLTQTKKLMLLK